MQVHVLPFSKCTYTNTYPIGGPVCISPYTMLLFSSDTLVVNRLAIAGKYTPRNTLYKHCQFLM